MVSFFTPIPTFPHGGRSYQLFHHFPPGGNKKGGKQILKNSYMLIINVIYVINFFLLIIADTHFNFKNYKNIILVAFPLF